MFGLEKGFEKFVVMGRLHGWGDMLASQFASSATEKEVGVQHAAKEGCTGVGSEGLEREGREGPDGAERGGRDRGDAVAGVKGKEGKEARLKKNIRTLWALTEPASMDTANTEDTVAAFEDRVRRAEGKGKVVGRLVGEVGLGGEERRLLGEEVREKGEKGEMEMDFTGMGKRV